MKRRTVIALGLSIVAAGCATTLPSASRDHLVQQVTQAEVAFAKTMADRDFNAFLHFVAEDAVFLNGGKPLRGRAAIAEYWKPLYSGPAAPFSWKPEIVEVIGSGNLAQSTGPVTSSKGKLIARFYSTWRLDPDGNWRVVLDNGYDVCDCPAK